MSGRRVIFFAVCIGGALAAADASRAQLFACKGEDGRARFVSSASQCNSAYRELPSFDGDKQRGGGGNHAAKKPRAVAPSSSSAPGKFAKVPPRRQTALDKKRGEILLYELRREESIYGALEGLIAGADDDAKRARLVRRRGEHARNIAAIRRELERLGYVAAAE